MNKKTLGITLGLALALFVLISGRGGDEPPAVDHQSKEMLAIVVEDGWSTRLLVVAPNGTLSKKIDLGELGVESFWAAPSAGRQLVQLGTNQWFEVDADGLKSVEMPAVSSSAILESAWSGPAGGLFFIKNLTEAPGDDGSLFQLKPGATEETKLAVPPAGDGRDARFRNLALSPRGDKIAFEYTGAGDPAAQNEEPPDSSLAAGANAIFVVDVGSGEQKKLVEGQGPVWSPDGSRLAYTASASHEAPGGFTRVYNDLYVVEADGSNNRLVAQRGESPAWSADGSRLGYIEARADGEPRERPKPGYVIPAEGGRSVLIANDVGLLSWAAKGGRLTFRQTENPAQPLNTISLFDVDKVQKQKLTDSYSTSLPQWSSDGEAIAFFEASSDRSGGADKESLWLSDKYGRERFQVKGLDIGRVVGFSWVR
jgi:hypothetical protein